MKWLTHPYVVGVETSVDMSMCFYIHLYYILIMICDVIMLNIIRKNFMSFFDILKRTRPIIAQLYYNVVRGIFVEFST